MNQHTKKYLQQWIIKANEDLLTINRLTDGEIIANSSICFHCQQLAEKYLKLFLIYNNKEIEKTHNIEFLLSECSKIDIDFEKVDPKNLSDFGVTIRYPDDFYQPSLEEVIEYKALSIFIKNLVESKIKI